jgi:hypothetical protein
MRYGSIEAEKISKEILLLSDFLGVAKLVTAAKFRISSSMGHAGIEEELIQAFDEAYGYTFHSVPTGTLKKAMNEPFQEMYEFASIFLHNPPSPLRPKPVAPPYRAGVRSMLFAPNNGATERPGWLPKSETGGYLLPVYALNWLGKERFSVAPEEMQTFDHGKAQKDSEEHFLPDPDNPRPSDTGACLGELLFIRSKNIDSEEVIVSTARNTTSKNEQREYATLNAVNRMNNCVFIQCAGGELESIPRLNGAELRRTGRLHCTNIDMATDWLQKHRFHRREPQLEKFLSEAQKETSDDFYNEYTMVFSRPLCETEPLMPERDLIDISFKNYIIGNDGF